ncbi:MAG: hypothetical protein IPK82_13985 [Polyangiaceae bacterium]|nr:hypothetical protein [Polyangiaceae bacterium]
MNIQKWMVVGAFLTVVGSFGTARADVPGPREECEVDGLGCEACWQSYGSGEDDQKAFNECAEKLKAKGLSEACRHRQGAGDSVFFCPAGVNAGKTVKGGGCGACSVGSEGDLPLSLSLGALLAVSLVYARRRLRKN